MRVGIVLAPRQHFAVAGDGLLEAAQLRQRHAAIKPSRDIVGRRGDGALVGGDRLGVAAEFDQDDAAVEMRHGMLRHERQRCIKIGKRAFGKSERGLREPAIEAGLEMLRLAGEHGLQFGQRLAVPIEADERVGVLIEDIDILGRERAGLVETLQRVGRALERILRLAEIALRRRDPRISFDRGAEQALRLAELALLYLDRAEEIERIEMIGRGLEHACIDSLRLAQLSLPVQRHGFAERLAEIEGSRTCFHRRALTADWSGRCGG